MSCDAMLHRIAAPYDTLRCDLFATFATCSISQSQGLHYHPAYGVVWTVHVLQEQVAETQRLKAELAVAALMR